jgi:hypothetical protein
MIFRQLLRKHLPVLYSTTGIRQDENRHPEHHFRWGRNNSRITKEKREQLSQNFSTLGFELPDKSKQQLIEKIKNFIIKQVHHIREQPELF